MNQKMKEECIKNQCQSYGGLAVIAGFLVSIIYLLITMTIENKIDLFTYEEYGKKLLGVLLGIVVIGITCFIDDIKNIKPLVKLSGQLLAAIIVVAFGVRIDNVNLPFFNNINEWASIVLTVFWIIGITNSINLIDGLDGLSSGISVISCISLIIIFALNSSPLIAIIMVTALAGALIGFLPYNFNPAKTFLGDTGSNFLGFTLSIISILGIAKTYTVVVIVLPIIVLALPIFDTIFAIIRRIITGKSLKAVFMADKGHLHHKLVARGFSQKQAVLILYGLSATLGMFAVILLDSGIWKAISFALMIVAVIGLCYKNFTKFKDSDIKQYECINCKYIYNPKYGNESAGIERDTEFLSLPENWVCPVCGKEKELFQPYKE